MRHKPGAQHEGECGRFCGKDSNQIAQEIMQGIEKRIFFSQESIHRNEVMSLIYDAMREAKYEAELNQEIKFWESGFAAAREKAAGIVESYRWDRDKLSAVTVIDLIVDAVRAMEVDK